MILLTGATGFIGSKLLPLLAGMDGEKIRCLVSGSANRCAIQSLDNVEQANGDLFDTGSLLRALKGVQVVVHLAGVRVSAVPSEYIRINTEGTRNLVNACTHAGTKEFIFISTLNAGLELKNVYATSKLESENLIKQSDLQWIIVRPSLVYGPNDESVVSKYIKMLATGGIAPILGGGENEIHPIYIDDFASIICDIIRTRQTHLCKTYVVAGPDTISYNKMADVIANEINKRALKIHIPLWPIKIIVNALSPFIGEFKGIKDKLITYAVNKNEAGTTSQRYENIFPLTHFEQGVRRIIRSSY